MATVQNTDFSLAIDLLPSSTCGCEYRGASESMTLASNWRAVLWIRLAMRPNYECTQAFVRYYPAANNFVC